MPAMSSSVAQHESECLARLFGDRFQFIQGKRGYRFAIDSLILASEPASLEAPLLDLGCADGILPILLWRRFTIAPLVGLEIQPQLAARARRNAEMHGAAEAIEIIEGDLCRARELLPAQGFRSAISNPPYYAHKSGRLNTSSERAVAYHEIRCTMSDVLRAARYALRPDGSLWLIYPVERFHQLVSEATKLNLNIERLRFVHPFADQPANRLIAQLRPNRRAAPVIAPPLVVYREAGCYSDEIASRIETLVGLSTQPPVL